jgi:mannose-6-phosphate isomerase-like protein (cupin superfamily)
MTTDREGTMSSSSDNEDRLEGGMANPPASTSLLVDHSALPDGTLEGFLTGASVSLIFDNESEGGRGPRLHRHPYDETFIVLAGSARFTLGATTVVAREGQLLVAPATVPHKFETITHYRAIHVHSSPRFITEWLE